MMRKNSNLKEIYIVRYADDFKIFCKSYKNAQRIFYATQMWLKQRLSLEISPEKSSIVDVRKKNFEFLGFEIGTKKSRNTYVIESHMYSKAIERVTKELKASFYKVLHTPHAKAEYSELTKYNAKVIGIQEYYEIATKITADLRIVGFAMSHLIKVKPPSNKRGPRIKKDGKIEELVIQKRYGKSKQVRFINGHAIAPISYVQFRIPKSKSKDVNKYTPEGRKTIHKELNTVDIKNVLTLMKTVDEHVTIEYADNRISKYIAQKGKCIILKQALDIDDIHCHHIQPKEYGGSDSYNNLIIVHKDIHILIHATKQKTINFYINKHKLNKKQLDKLNVLRKQANREKIK